MPTADSTLIWVRCSRLLPSQPVRLWKTTSTFGVSSLAAGHKTLIPQVIEELKKLGREDIVVIAGGVIPVQDYDFLYKAGVAAIFGPGTPITKSAIKMIEILNGEE